MTWGSFAPLCSRFCGYVCGHLHGKENVKSWKGSMNTKGCPGCWNCWTGGRIWIVCLRLVSSASDIFLYVLSRKWYIKDEKKHSNRSICRPKVKPTWCLMHAAFHLITRNDFLSLNQQHTSPSWSRLNGQEKDQTVRALNLLSFFNTWNSNNSISCIISTLNQGWRFTWGLLLGHLPRSVHHPPH